MLFITGLNLSDRFWKDWSWDLIILMSLFSMSDSVPGMLKKCTQDEHIEKIGHLMTIHTATITNAISYIPLQIGYRKNPLTSICMYHNLTPLLGGVPATWR
jgi:hypothetical protein